MNIIHRTSLTASATALLASSVLTMYRTHYSVGTVTAVAGVLTLAYYHHTVSTHYEDVHDDIRDDIGFSDEDMERAAEDIADAAEDVYERAYEDGRQHGAEDGDDDNDSHHAFQ